MKRCPECRRDYYDDTLLYCLDDGNALLEGPASVDEPATAILSEPGAIATGFPASESPTRAQINTTDQTAIFRTGAEAEPQESLGGHSEKRSFSAHRAEKPHGKVGSRQRQLAVLAIAVLLLVGGFFGYRYFEPFGSKQIESIAVMPFVNESGNADVEYLSDGMTETLIKSLSSLPELDVKPRSSVFRYKGKDTDLQTIGKELNVQAILTGRLIQRGDQLTLSLELIDVQNDKVIWTDQYHRRQSDVVSLQSEIAKDVLTHIKAKLSGADAANVTKTGTVDPQAYQAYLKGRYFWNRRTAVNLKKALEEFTIATDRDPNYALAFVGLADCYVVLHEYAGMRTAETLPKARAFAERALSLDPGLAEAHTTLGAVAYNSWQWAESEKEFKFAIAAHPTYPTTYHWYSILLRIIGRFDEAAAMIERAQELDPVSSVIAVNVALTYQMPGNHEASIRKCLQIIELDPNFPAAYSILALSYLKHGRNTDAIANLEKAVELSNRAGVTLVDLGYGYGVTEKRAEAEAIAKELEEKYARRQANAMYVAGVYAGLGEKDQAFEWLEKGFQAKEELGVIRFRIPYESLRDDLRYKDLLKRMNLPE